MGMGAWGNVIGAPKMPHLTLTVELVPHTSWYNNMRKVVSPADWDRIRKKTYADYGHRCGICGAQGTLNCHERWVYDDDTYGQKLAGFIALCDMCHHVKHIGLAGVLAARGELDYERVIDHFRRVNDCDRQTFDDHLDRAFDVWRERSQHAWVIDFGVYAALVADGEHRTTRKRKGRPSV